MIVINKTNLPAEVQNAAMESWAELGRAVTQQLIQQT